ncbi:hypothetical protein D3C71_78730 [compost metagenome]
MRDLAANSRTTSVLVDWPPELGIEHYACGIVTMQMRNDPDDHVRNYMPINWSTVVELIDRRCRLAQNELVGMQDPALRQDRDEHLLVIPKVTVPALKELDEALSGRLVLSHDQTERSLILHFQPLPMTGEPKSDWRIRLVLGHW